MKTKTNEWRDCFLTLSFISIAMYLLLFICPKL